MDQQDKIDLVADGNKLIEILDRFEVDFVWTRLTLIRTTGWTTTRIDNATAWLENREYITVRGGAYRVTTEGREHYYRSMCNPRTASPIIWKTEALTGVKQSETKKCDGDWQRSSITNGALPATSKIVYPDTSMTPEDVVLKSEEAEQYKKIEKKTARSLGLPLREFKRLLQKGLIRQCNGGGQLHIGRFKPRGVVCVECQKKR